MSNINLVCDYLHCDYLSALDLPCDMFQSVVRNAFIDRMLQSDGGRQQLKDYIRLNTTEPDMDTLKKQFEIINKGE